MRKCILFILFAYLTVNAQSQPGNLYFKKLTYENGLSNNKVKCILQDKRGFIWMGTEDGLNRFDGTHFVVFRHQPTISYGISGNIITDLLEDQEGILWIATEDGGLNRYDYRLPPREQFRQFKHIPEDTSSIPVNVINSIIEDKLGNLWLATSGASVIRLNKKTGRFDFKVKVGRTVYDLCMDKKGVIWGGREGGSILKIDPVTCSIEVQKKYDNFYLKLPHVVVTTLFKDSDNNMWFGSWDKALYRYNASTGQEDVFSPNPSAFSFLPDEPISFNEDAQGRIWIGGKHNGLYIYDKTLQRFYNYRHDPSKEGSLINNTVNCVYIDKLSNTWIATNGGISIYSPFEQQFRQQFLESEKQDSTDETVIYDFYKDSNQVVWIGTSRGIYTQGPAGNLSHSPILYNDTPLHVTRFYKDIDGSMYIGTNYSLFAFNPLTKQISPLANTTKDLVMRKLIESRIVSAVRDTINGNPALVVSPYGHFIAYYDLVEKKWVSRKDSTEYIQRKYNIIDNLVRKMMRSRSGKIWMANVKEGLGEWRASAGKPIRYYRNDPHRPETISNNSVYDMVEDNRSNLWVSTYGGGLNYFNTHNGKFFHISATNNLLEGIQTDDHGNVWMISNGNLHKYDIRTQSHTSFRLPDIENSGGVKGNIYKSRDGLMYLAGTNYFISFHPDSIKVTKAQPDVIFTDFRIFNTSNSHLLFQNKIVLQYDQNFFTMEFSAPYFSGAGSVRYSYMLENVDKDWVDAGTKNFNSYSNIAGGTYRFKVRATANPGTWSNRYAAIDITIIPPFWKRWWFAAACTAVICLVIYAVYRYRINELVKRQTMRNKIAQDLHDNVGSTLSSISIYSQVAKIQSEQHNEKELHSVLDKIGITSNEMISEMNDIVWTINPRNDNMEKILQRMESFAKPLMAAKGIHFQFAVEPGLLTINLDMEKRKNFYLIFKEAISNMIKYSGSKNGTVQIRSRHHFVEMVVSDDGAGFDKTKLQQKLSDSLSGNGLRNMALRAKEMNGLCIITAEPGKGTTVHLTFPVT